MPRPKITPDAKRKLIDKLAEFFESESVYCPYSDHELSRKLKCDSWRVRHYRIHYLGLPSAQDRRVAYAAKKEAEGKEDECREQVQRKTPKGKGAAKERKTRSKTRG